MNPTPSHLPMTGLDLTVAAFERLDAPINWGHFADGLGAGFAIGMALT